MYVIFVYNFWPKRPENAHGSESYSNVLTHFGFVISICDFFFFLFYSVSLSLQACSKQWLFYCWRSPQPPGLWTMDWWGPRPWAGWHGNDTAATLTVTMILKTALGKCFAKTLWTPYKEEHRGYLQKSHIDLKLYARTYRSDEETHHLCLAVCLCTVKPPQVYFILSFLLASEVLFRDMADRLAEDGWRELGYVYINIDDCWALKKRDAQGRLQADPKRHCYLTYKIIF